MVREGDNVFVCLRVSNGSLERNIPVYVKSIGDTTSTGATPGKDFTELVTVITISSNEATCIELNILNDNILEGCEAFYVAYEVDPNLTGVAAIPRDKDKSVVIIVDDSLDGVEVGFNQSYHLATEGQTEPINVCIEITFGTLERNVNINLYTLIEERSAVLNEDYRGINQKTLTFGSSISVICTNFTILDDDLLESTETITLSLSASLEDIAVVNFSLPQTTIEIQEDTVDGVTVALRGISAKASESDGSVEVHVCAELLRGHLGDNLSVSLVIEDIDDSHLPDIIAFMSGSSKGAITCNNVTITSLLEGVKTFSSKLTTDFAGVIVSSGSTSVRITNSGKGVRNCTVCLSEVLPAAVIVASVILSILLTIFANFLIRKKIKTKSPSKTGRVFLNCSATTSNADESLRFKQTDFNYGDEEGKVSSAMMF